MNNKLLAESLLEWTRESTTSFLAEEDKELMEKAAKLDIQLPSPDLAIFKTIYAEIDKPNRNHMLLPKKAVEVGLQTLKGKQINWEHYGSGHVCGYILDAKIEDDHIVIYGALFKSLFKEEFDKVQELFNDKKLFVSFEIWNRNEAGESVLHVLPNNVYAIDPIIFHGCGLLLEHAPACPNARVMKLLASDKIMEEANSIIEKIFEKDMNLVYAELAIEEPKCKGCNPCTCREGGEQHIMAEENTHDVILEAPATEVKAEEVIVNAEEAAPEITPKPEETTVQAEVTVTEPVTTEVTVSDALAIEVTPKEEVVPVEATPENTEAAAVVTQKQEMTRTDDITPEAEVVTTEVKTETIAVNDEGKEVMKVEETVVRVETYTREQLAEAVKQVEEAKDKEIATMKQELDSLRQEIESLKIVKAKEVVPDLTVGTVETPERYKTIRSEIDKRAFGTK